jgi:streptomycin 3"-adenylyltransferase
VTASKDAADDQVEAVVAVVRDTIRPKVAGLYLYGSSVVGGLRPDSDLDLFVVAHARLEPDEKAALVERLLPLSGRATRPAGWRPVELTVVALPDVRPFRYPPRLELEYGEWLREAFLAGNVEPAPNPNPDLAVLLVMVRESSRAVIGPPAAELVDPVPRMDLVRAMTDAVPSLLDDLESDTRNVLLTLARIWMTVATGAIGPKDVAADWALERLPDADRPILERARDLYREGGYGDWTDAMAAVQALAGRLVAEIERLAAATLGDKPPLTGR